MEEQKENEALLQLIPTKRLSSQQKAFKKATKGLFHFYRLTREPTHFDEFDLELFQTKPIVAIWRENETVTFVTRKRSTPHAQKHVYFELYHRDQRYQCAIFGENNSVIAETVTFFWSL